MEFEFYLGNSLPSNGLEGGAPYCDVLAVGPPDVAPPGAHGAMSHGHLMSPSRIEQEWHLRTSGQMTSTALLVLNEVLSKLVGTLECNELGVPSWRSIALCRCNNLIIWKAQE